MKVKEKKIIYAEFIRENVRNFHVFRYFLKKNADGSYTFTQTVEDDTCRAFDKKEDIIPKEKATKENLERLVSNLKAKPGMEEVEIKYGF